MEISTEIILALVVPSLIIGATLGVAVVKIDQWLNRVKPCDLPHCQCGKEEDQQAVGRTNNKRN